MTNDAFCTVSKSPILAALVRRSLRVRGCFGSETQGVARKLTLPCIPGRPFRTLSLSLHADFSSSERRASVFASLRRDKERGKTFNFINAINAINAFSAIYALYALYAINASAMKGPVLIAGTKNMKNKNKLDKSNKLNQLNGLSHLRSEASARREGGSVEAAGASGAEAAGGSAYGGVGVSGVAAVQGRPGPVITLQTLLLPYQKRWVNDKSRFKIGVWSRQTGKSLCTAAEAVTDCILDPGTTWICISAGERQALEWLEKAKDWVWAMNAVVDAECVSRDTPEALLRQAEIRFPNGSRIQAIPANPSTARGYSANIVLDEFAYHENADAVWSAMFPSQGNPLANTFRARVQALLKGEDYTKIQREMKVRVVSTFAGRDNKFYSLWERRAETGYSGHFVDIHQAFREGLGVKIEQLRAGLDDAEIWAQEYECVPADVSSVLLPYELLASCESTEATTIVGSDFFSGSKPYVMGIDFGRSKNLTVAWTDELMGDVSHCREVIEMRDMPTPDQLAALRPRISRARRVCFDYTGGGIGLGDLMVKEFGEYDPQKHRFGKIELCKFTNALKVEVFSKLRMAFEQRKCRIPINRVIREDLHSMQRVTTMSGMVTYRAPHTDDGHADRCTAKALAQRAAGFQSGPVAYARVQTRINSSPHTIFGVGKMSSSKGWPM